VLRLFAALALSLALVACQAVIPHGEAEPARASRDRAAIDAAIADPRRPAEDRVRDATSKPADVLALLGVAPGMRVLDVNAAGGYYSELLARTVGSTGHVIAHNHPGARTMLPAVDLERRYGDGRLPNVEQIFVRHADLVLPDESLDAVLMSMVYHDLYWDAPGVDWGPIDARALLRSLHRALRPGAVVGVVDHTALAGSDPAVSAHALHRIDPAVVVADFTAAGFVLDAQSDALRNSGDDLRRSVFDAAVHGQTDRFVLRFRRPR
jgi:predicted methyltransferase